MSFLNLMDGGAKGEDKDAMEIDGVEGREKEWDWPTDGWGEEGEEEAVEGANGVKGGKGKGGPKGGCYTCGGAHYQSNCPQGGGKGKGSSKGMKGGDKGKGKGKGGMKGKGKGPASGGCFTCGGAHYQANCPKWGQQNLGNQVRSLDEPNIGSYYCIHAVTQCEGEEYQSQESIGEEKEKTV